MPSAMFQVTAANFAVGNDIFTVGGGLGAKQAQKGNGVPRRIHGIALVGSTNAADCAIDLYAGTKYLGSFYNTTGGANVAPKMDGDLQPIYSEDYLPAGVELIGMVNDAAATNPVTVLISWEDKIGSAFASDVMVTKGGAARRSYGSSGGYRKRTYSRRRRSY